MNRMVEKTKEWYQSKTVWANILTFLIAVLALVPDLSFLTPQVVEVLLLVSAVANIALRMWCNTTTVSLPLGLGRKK